MNGLGTVCCWRAHGLDSVGNRSWFGVSRLEDGLLYKF